MRISTIILFLSSFPDVVILCMGEVTDLLIANPPNLNVKPPPPPDGMLFKLFILPAQRPLMAPLLTLLLDVANANAIQGWGGNEHFFPLIHGNASTP